MSTMRPMDVTCRVCKKKSEQIILTSTNSFGSPDLDLRPPEMQRSTMCFWVQRCPSCGYVASSIDDSTNATRDYLNSDDYKNAKGRNFKSDLAKNSISIISSAYWTVKRKTRSTRRFTRLGRVMTAKTAKMRYIAEILQSTNSQDLWKASVTTKISQF